MKLDISSAMVLLVAVFSGTNPASANKIKPCDYMNGCRQDEICHLGKCIKKTSHNDECFTKPCKYGFYCNEHGKCIKDTPCHLECGPGKECYLQPVQCIRAPCPPVLSCRADKCAFISCSHGEVCEGGVCVFDSKCAVTRCAAGTYCYKGRCLRKVDCQGQCGPAQNCYIDTKPTCPCIFHKPKVVCIFDKCATVKCREGNKCENGVCVPDVIKC